MLSKFIIDNMYETPWLDTGKASTKVNRGVQRPKKSTLKIALDVISQYRDIRRNLLIKKSELSGHAINRCIETLLEDKLIIRTKVGRAGGYTAYTYKAAR